MKGHQLLALVWLAGSPALSLADPSAYVVASSTGLASIFELSLSKGAFGSAIFAPAGGGGIAVAPRTKQIWEATNDNSINVLNPQNGATLATIPLSGSAGCLSFDAAGKYAYAYTGNLEHPGSVLEIDVASRSIVRSAAVGGNTVCLGVAFSTDASKLFFSFENGTLVLNAISLKQLTELTQNGSLFVSGNTLLISSYQSELLY